MLEMRTGGRRSVLMMVFLSEFLLVLQLLESSLDVVTLARQIFEQDLS